MPIRPLTTMASAMEVITEELWMMAVNTAPSRTSSKGLPMPARKVFTPSRAANDSKSAQPEAEEKSLAWQVNGRCDPHTIYIYAPGEDWRETDWRIRVDRFGAVKVLAKGEDE